MGEYGDKNVARDLDMSAKIWIKLRRLCEIQPIHSMLSTTSSSACHIGKRATRKPRRLGMNGWRNIGPTEKDTQDIVMNVSTVLSDMEQSL